MAWGNFGTQDGSSGKSRSYVEQGNAKLFLFSETPAKCAFLTEDGEPSPKKWTMPKSQWEHQVKSIPQVRFFSTIACTGRGCRFCRENASAREKGVVENKLLPYPVQKRFYVPAYFYDLDAVLFVRGSETFFSDIAKYLDRFGSASDFEIFRVGKGFQTKYMATYLGASAASLEEVRARHSWVSPLELDLRDSPEEIDRKLAGGRVSGDMDSPSPSGDADPVTDPVPDWAAEGQTERSKAEEPVPEWVREADAKLPLNVQGLSAGEFRIPFGMEKGKTFRDLLSEGKAQDILFYAKSGSAGIAQEAQRFIDSHKESF